VSERERRFFAGNSLAQAVAAAASHFGLEPEALAYRVRERRHGFVKLPRKVVIEVDPGAPRRSDEPPVSAPPPPAGAEPAPAPRPARQSRPGGRAASAPHEERPRRGARREEHAERSAAGETWRAADEESALAAGEATRRLLRLAGLELEPRVRIVGERLEIELEGADEGRLRELGLEFLEDLEHLLPRAAHGLCGKLVRARVEGAGLRAAREEELRALARATAERVVSSGREHLLGPLEPAERRIVHLELKERGDVATESVGSGFLKRVRVSLVAS
jgi:predicted RNA-binding protein Jag